MLWINFLHFYQPATAEDETVIEAAEKSYERIIGALSRNRKIKFTINITGCLLEKWHMLGFDGLIGRIKGLVKAGQIELVGTAANHSLLPFMPKAEVERQIRINREILEKYFGRGVKPRGFFIPEATYSRAVAKSIKKLGFEWIILDELAAFGKFDSVDFTKGYIDKYSGLKLCFRSRRLSKNYVPHEISAICDSKSECIIVTATDAELYGLRHNDVSANFEKLLKKKGLRTETVSRYLQSLKKTIVITPVASSWETTAEELARNKPYQLWRDPQNGIQVKLWQLADLAIKTVAKNKKDINYAWSRAHLDKGLASCTFWWASGKDFRLYSPASWNPDEIERGLNQLVRSIRALDNIGTRTVKIRAEKLYIAIKKMIWQKHWRYYWKKT